MGGFADDFGRIKYNGIADIDRERVSQRKFNNRIGQAKIL